MKNTPTSMDHLLQENRSFPPNPTLYTHSVIQNEAQYQALYQASIQDPDTFWLEHAKSLHWIKAPSIACKYTWDTKKNTVQHTWFQDGCLNISENCIDRHVKAGLGEKVAILFQGDDDNDVRKITYNTLLTEVSKFANVLKRRGITKGDRVCLYMPMTPEALIAMLACARIGAIHSVVFGGFSEESLSHRINDCQAKLLITANVAKRGGKTIFLKEIADEALIRTPSIEHVLVYQRTDAPCPMDAGRDLFLEDELKEVSELCPAEPMNAEDPLFILYTSGSTGKPKGVVHTGAGYLLYTSLTHKYLFDLKQDDIYWCTADIGWVTGHSYVVYGPLSNGATTLMFEGIPTHPDPGRFWQVIEKFKVSIFYTAPTAIRALIRHGETYPKKYNLNSLRILGSVGEPINPEAWMWYYEVIGKGKAPIADTYWQTETGGILLSSFVQCHAIKPSSAGRPFFGVEPLLLKEDGSLCAKDEGGSLCIKRPFPGMMRTTWGDHQRFIDTYFSKFDNVYFTGDGCRIDQDGDFFLMGRLDDVVNISGHRIGTAEVESALVSHEAVAEAAAVSIPHDIKGESLHVFVTLVDGVNESKELIKELELHVRKEIGAIAVPDKFQFTKALPKTRSGKIMRRILRKIATKETDDLGDISTLADPSVIESLIKAE